MSKEITKIMIRGRNLTPLTNAERQRRYRERIRVRLALANNRKRFIDDFLLFLDEAEVKLNEISFLKEVLKEYRDEYNF